MDDKRDDGRCAERGDAGPPQEPVRDVVGVGFGPANLGLAIALEEEEPQVDALFLESKPGFSWHEGMLLPGANMQISFLKDLVLMRNPTSPFSYLNFLHDQMRLVDFINRQTFTPERIEFAEYLKWAAARVCAEVRYATTVTRIERLVRTGPGGERFLVHLVTEEPGTGARRTGVVPARSVVIARGLTAVLPEWARAEEMVESGVVFHNIELLPRIRPVFAGLRPPRRVLVVGAGQSAAETVRFFHEQDDVERITCVFTSYGFVASDDSPFANRIFDPDAVDDFYSAPEDLRGLWMSRHRHTNYACVEPELIEDLYEREYREKVRGPRRLDLRRGTVIEGAALDPEGGVSVRLRNRITGEAGPERFDVVVCATGFRTAPVRDLCPDLDNREASVARDYHVTLDGVPVPGLLVLSDTERTHGLSSTLLSNVAARSAELVETIRRYLGDGSAAV